jgi:hypothetical protein
MAARSQLSKDMEKEVSAYIKANPDDMEFGSLLTVAQKSVKLYDRSAEDFSLKLNKFSTEVDLDKQKSPSTRNTKRRLFKRIMDRNMERLLQEQARVASAATARFPHLHPAACCGCGCGLSTSTLSSYDSAFGDSARPSSLLHSHCHVSTHHAGTRYRCFGPRCRGIVVSSNQSVQCSRFPSRFPGQK